MEPLSKVLKINFMVLLLSSMILFFVLTIRVEGNEILLVGAYSIFITGIQSGVNLVLSIISYIRRKWELGHAYLICVPVVLAIGFSFCYGNILLGALFLGE